MHSISSKPADLIQTLFRGPKALIGVVHCPAFPGAPRYRGASMESIYDACMRDVDAYVSGGLNGLIIENHGDIPFSKPDDIGPETTGFLSVIADRVIRSVDIPVGINVLANAPIPAFATAVASGAAFIRVNQWANAYVANEGFMEGRAAQAMRYRSSLGANHVKVFTDTHVKHGAHAIVSDRSVTELTRDLAFFDSDAIIATGQRTGNAVDTEQLHELRRATELPLLIGSGVTAANLPELLPLVDAVIVASSLKKQGDWWNEVELERVQEMVDVALECGYELPSSGE